MLSISNSSKSLKSHCTSNNWPICYSNANRPDHNIRMYWTNFWQPTVHVKQNIFEKNLIKFGSSNLYNSFGTFCVNIGQLFEAKWDFKLSEEFEIDVIFLRKHPFYRFQTFFKDLLCLQKLTNLDSKCAKRSVNMWATNFY